MDVMRWNSQIEVDRGFSWPKAEIGSWETRTDLVRPSAKAEVL